MNTIKSKIIQFSNYQIKQTKKGNKIINEDVYNVVHLLMYKIIAYINVNIINTNTDTLYPEYNYEFYKQIYNSIFIDTITDTVALSFIYSEREIIRLRERWSDIHLTFPFFKQNMELLFLYCKNAENYCHKKNANEIHNAIYLCKEFLLFDFNSITKTRLQSYFRNTIFPELMCMTWHPNRFPMWSHEL